MPRFTVVLVVLSLVAVALSQRVRVVNAATNLEGLSLTLSDGAKNTSVTPKVSTVGSYKPFDAGNPLCATVFLSGAAVDSFCSVDLLEDSTDYTLLVMGDFAIGGDVSVDIQLYEDNPKPPELNTEARLSVTFASANVTLRGNTLWLNLTSKSDTSVQYLKQFVVLGQQSAEFNVPADDYYWELKDCNSSAVCVTRDGSNQVLTLDALNYYSIFLEGVENDLFLVKSVDETFDPSVFLRVLNLAPATLGQAIDVYLDSTLTVAGLEYAVSLANYTQVFQSSYTVKIVPAGGALNGTILAKTKVDFTLDTTVLAYTLVFSSDAGANSSISATLFDDDISAPSSRYQRVRVINAIGAGPVAVTIVEQASLLPASQTWERVKYEDVSDSVTLPAANYTIAATGAGNVTIDFTGLLNLMDSSVYTIFTYVQPGAASPFTYLLSRDYAYPPPLPVSLIRLINGAILDPTVKKPPTLSLESDGDVLIKNVSYGKISEYVAVESSSPNLQLYFGSSLMWTSPKNLGQYRNWTIALSGSVVDGTVMPMIYSDDLTQLAAPKLRLLNLNLGTVSVQLNGSGIDVSADYMDITPYQNASSKGTSKLTLTGQSASASDLVLSLSKSLKNGVVYTVVAFGEGGTKKDNVTAPFSAVMVTDYPQKSNNGSTGLTALELTLIIGGSVLLAVIVLAILILGIRKKPEVGGYETLGDDTHHHH